MSQYAELLEQQVVERDQQLSDRADQNERLQAAVEIGEHLLGEARGDYDELNAMYNRLHAAAAQARNYLMRADPDGPEHRAVLDALMRETM